MPPLIRAATWGDLGAVVELMAQMGGHTDTATPELIGPQLAASLADPAGRMLIAEVDGVAVGMLDLHAHADIGHAEREGWIRALAVREGFRGTRVGAALLGAAAREAALLGCVSLVVVSAQRRERAHRFYRRAGFGEPAGPARRFHLPLDGPDDAGLAERFLRHAALAATAAAAAVAAPRLLTDPDADLAAERAAVAALVPLGLPVISEESGVIGPPLTAPEQPWISLDPLDGSRNYREGYPPWATAIGLVVDGRSIAGFVCEHTSGRRWWAAAGRGAVRDGVPIRARRGALLAVPSLAPGSPPPDVPAGFSRLRMSGSTTIDLCQVADGALGGFLDDQRGVVYTHDLAGPLAILTAAGAVVRDLDGCEPRLDPPLGVANRRGRCLVAAADNATAQALLSVARRLGPFVHRAMDMDADDRAGGDAFGGLGGRAAH